MTYTDIYEVDRWLVKCVEKVDNQGEQKTCDWSGHQEDYSFHFASDHKQPSKKEEK